MSRELKISKKQFEELISKLDALIKLTAANVFHSKPMTDSIPFLADLGFKNKEIAKILGTTPAYVNKVKYETKKDKQKQKSEKKSRARGGKKSGGD